MNHKKDTRVLKGIIKMNGVATDSHLSLMTQKSPTVDLKFIAFGNALMDISVKIGTSEILNRYNFGANEQGECDNDKLNRILIDLQKEYDNIDYHAGGSAINTCRIISELGQKDIIFNGAVGKDDNGLLLESMLSQNEVKTCLQKIDGQATGLCVCLIHEDNRCCFANIGASLHYSLNTMALKSILHDTSERIFYIEGFFVTNRLEVCQYVVENFCHGHQKHSFAANLSAEYIINENPIEINYLADKANILFGNRDEFNALTKLNGLITIVDQIGRLMDSSKHSRKIIIVTNGDKFVDVYVKQADSLEVQHNRLDVVAVNKAEIVDTTGAGDSFAAGFFYAQLNGDSVLDSVYFGIQTAAKKIRKIGAKL